MGRTRSHLKRMFPSEYVALKNAIYRCYDETNIAYELYGERGVTVCDEWRTADGFAKFLDHVGPKPSPDHSLDRIDNLNGHYAPGQVRWTDYKTQSNNRRPARYKVKDYGWGIGHTPKMGGQGQGGKPSPLLPFEGGLRTLAELAREHEVRGATVRARLARGLTVEQALNPSTSRAGLKHKGRNNFVLPVTH